MLGRGAFGRQGLPAARGVEMPDFAGRRGPRRPAGGGAPALTGAARFGYPMRERPRKGLFPPETKARIMSQDDKAGERGAGPRKAEVGHSLSAATSQGEVDRLNSEFYGKIKYPWPPTAFDRVIEVTPLATQPIVDAVALVRPGGTVVLGGFYLLTLLIQEARRRT